MAPAQMALPMEARRNGASDPRPAPQRGPVLDPVPAPVEPVVMSEVPRWVRRTTTAGVLVVALVAAIGSYEHMRALGVEVGEGWRAGLLPFSVDGLALVAAMTMLVRRWNGQKAGLLAWVALVASLGVSLAANVAAAEPTIEARLWAAWPPVGLLLAMELLMQQIKARGGPGLETVRPGASNPFDGGDRR
jgi:hypothetical protein